jgi:hypothetical protein
VSGFLVSGFLVTFFRLCCGWRSVRFNRLVVVVYFWLWYCSLRGSRLWYCSLRGSRLWNFLVCIVDRLYIRNILISIKE